MRLVLAKMTALLGLLTDVEYTYRPGSRCQPRPNKPTWHTEQGTMMAGTLLVLTS